MLRIDVSTDEKGVMLFRKDGTSRNGNPYTKYSVSISQKNANGEWESKWYDVQFKKDLNVDLPNKTEILINKGFVSFNTYNGQIYDKIVVTDMQVLKPGEAPNTDFVNVPSDIEADLPFARVGGR